AGQRDDVAPVAADLSARGAVPVPERDLCAVYRVESLRHERALQHQCGIALAHVQPRVVHRDRRTCGELFRGFQIDECEFVSLRRAGKPDSPKKRAARLERSDDAAFRASSVLRVMTVPIGVGRVWGLAPGVFQMEELRTSAGYALVECGTGLNRRKAAAASAQS